MKTPVTEDMHIEKEWFVEAKNQTVETLPKFINHLMNDYCHDYGTMVHAVSACGMAAIHAANNTDSGGITGFQASCVMWNLIRQICKTNNECGLRLIDYDDMLYPQYEDRFEKIISKGTFKCMQKCAKEKLDEEKSADVKFHAHPAVIAHWQSIVDGKVPFGYKLVDENDI